MVDTSVNIFAIVIAGLAGTIITGVWYSSFGFGNAWRRAAQNPEKLSFGWPEYTLAFCSSVIVAYILAIFINLGRASLLLNGQAIDGAIVAAWGWLGFTAATSLVNAQILHRKREVWVLESSQHLVSLLVMGTIISSL